MSRQDIQIALFNPEIPQNTGNVARLSAGFDIALHIVGTPGFSLTEKALRRAGVDYWHLVDLHHHASVWHLIDELGGGRLIPVTTRGQQGLANFAFQDGDILAFGNESSGLGPEIHRDFGANSLHIEQWGAIRSLNLATAVSVVLYQAVRQLRLGLTK